MAVEFAKYERQEGTLTSNGTVLDLVGKDGQLQLIPKNFKNVDKRVVIILKKENGTSTMISCSKAVSDGLRDKSIDLAHVLGFEVLENEDGVNFISMPGGELVTVNVKDLKVKDYVATAVSYDELIA